MRGKTVKSKYLKRKQLGQNVIFFFFFWGKGDFWDQSIDAWLALCTDMWVLTKDSLPQDSEIETRADLYLPRKLLTRGAAVSHDLENETTLLELLVLQPLHHNYPPSRIRSHACYTVLTVKIVVVHHQCRFFLCFRSGDRDRLDRLVERDRLRRSPGLELLLRSRDFLRFFRSFDLFLSRDGERDSI